MKKQKVAQPEIKRIPIRKLKAWGKNPRKSHAVEAIADSIQRFGFLQPIVVQAGTFRVLAGHGRLEALRRMGASEAVCVVAQLDGKKADQFTDEDNSLSAASSWDFGKLAIVLREMEAQDSKRTIGLLRASERARIEEILAAGDGKPEPEAKAGAPLVTKIGDVWECGRHLVVCGDSTDGDTIGAAIGKASAKVSLVFTDPPYGVSYEGPGGGGAKIQGDDKRKDDLANLVSKVLTRAAERAADDAAYYVWHASSTREDFAWALKTAGLRELQYLVWAKPGPVPGHGDYQYAHEPCFYACKDGHRPKFRGDRTQSTVWTFQTSGPREIATALGHGLTIVDGAGGQIHVTAAAPTGRKTRHVRLPIGSTLILRSAGGEADLWNVARGGPTVGHPTAKPVELALRALANSSDAGEIVLDPFLGGGTTLMACEQTGRVCAGIDIEPKWVDLAVRRWQAATGQRARNLTRAKEVLMVK